MAAKATALKSSSGCPKRSHHHPQTGRPVRRVVTAPRFTTKYTDAHDKTRLSDCNLKSNGFTKYVKGDDGKYEKVLGSGPDMIKRDPGE